LRNGLFDLRPVEFYILFILLFFFYFVWYIPKSFFYCYFSSVMLIKKIANLERFKYQTLYWQINKYVLIYFRLDVGHSYYEWNGCNYEYVTAIDKRSCVFDVELVSFELRRITSFLIHLFERQPFSRTLLISGSPLALKPEMISHLVSHLRCFDRLFFLRWLPGTLSNRSVMYSYWAREKYLNIRNQDTLKWRLADKTTALKISWLPDLVIGGSLAGEFTIMAKECYDLKIPVLGVVDSNVDVHGVMYPVRGNDDTARGLSILLTLFRNGINHGKSLAQLKFRRLLNRYSKKRTMPKNKKKLLKRLAARVGEPWIKIKHKLFNRLFNAKIERIDRKIKAAKKK